MVGKKTKFQYNKEMDELFYILKLFRTNNIGPVSFFYLINQFGSAFNAINNINFLEDKWKKKVKFAEDDLINQEIENTLKYGAKFLTYLNPCFPQQLKKNTPILITKGNENLLLNKMISVVGTRDPTINGLKFCANLVKGLGDFKFTIVSGFAKGIDIEAHKNSMKTGTIAVLAGGIDNIYPLENTKYYYEMLEENLIISDRQIGTVPSCYLFPKRNQIISSLGSAIVVIESKEASGALITAEMAKKIGKPVFALPGHPFDENYIGNNKLIKNGAFAITSIHDILDKLDRLCESKEELFFFENFSDEERKHVFHLIGFAPCKIEEVVLYSELSLEKVLSIITEMEILGLIKINPNNTVYKIKL